MLQVIKNINYPDFTKIDRNKIIRNQPTENYCSYQFYEAQHDSGINLFITKEVTDELEKVDLCDIDFDMIPFPASAMEFYFQEPTFPTVILLDNSKHTIITLDSKVWNENGISMYFERRDKEDGGTIISSSTNYNAEDLEHFFSADFSLEKLKKHYAGKVQQESLELSLRILKIIINVLLYISIPEYRAIPITRKDLRGEGKVGVKNRPNRPCSKVVYVPPIINMEKSTSYGATGKMVKPHFRRGHFMTLRHERYKKNIGKLVFVRPSMIHGGTLRDRMYVARKQIKQ